MRKAALMVGLLLAVGLCAGASSAAPRLTIPITNFDFGYVPQHSKISHSFWLHSNGDDDLKVLKVVPG